jgi:hypothetical protein
MKPEKEDILPKLPDSLGSTAGESPDFANSQFESQDPTLKFQNIAQPLVNNIADLYKDRIFHKTKHPEILRFSSLILEYCTATDISAEDIKGPIDDRKQRTISQIRLSRLKPDKKEGAIQNAIKTFNEISEDMTRLKNFYDENPNEKEKIVIKEIITSAINSISQKIQEKESEQREVSAIPHPTPLSRRSPTQDLSITEFMPKPPSLKDRGRKRAVTELSDLPPSTSPTPESAKLEFARPNKIQKQQ